MWASIGPKPQRHPRILIKKVKGISSRYQSSVYAAHTTIGTRAFHERKATGPLL